MDKMNENYKEKVIIKESSKIGGLKNRPPVFFKRNFILISSIFMEEEGRINFISEYNIRFLQK